MIYISIENNAAAEDKPDEASSESDVPRQIQTRKQANNHIIAGENRYPTRTGNHKISGIYVETFF